MVLSRVWDSQTTLVQVVDVRTLNLIKTFKDEVSFLFISVRFGHSEHGDVLLRQKEPDKPYDNA